MSVRSSLAALLAALCLPLGAAAQSKPVVIGAAVSLTGYLSDLGAGLRNGLQLWQEQVNAAGGLLGITREDKAGMARQHARNYAFFDAPVGFVFTLDRDLELGSWMDFGMFLQSIMLAARGKGLDTCPQAAIAHAHLVVRRELQIPESEQIVCGMSLGYARSDAIENGLVTVREPVANFTQFLGYE